jgi:branched-chain amino acid transport system ATP-binding protein
MSLLLVRGLHAFYGKSQVLCGVNLTVERGEIVALLGRNGAGRSTVAKALMGLVTTRGEVLWQGHPIQGKATYEIARLGLGYVPEGREVFPKLTVEQNLQLGHKPGALQGGKHDGWSIEESYAMAPVLKTRRHTLAEVLSGGEQQMLSLCRTLMGQPDLIIVDEPTEGLAPQWVAQVAELLNALRARGVSVLLIEQKLAIALEISQRCYVLGHGQVVFEGTPQALRARLDIQKEWLAV